MEAKTAKIGLIIMIAMVVARFMMTDEQKSDLSAMFSRNNGENFTKRVFKGVVESDILLAGTSFVTDYSTIKKRVKTKPNRVNPPDLETNLAENNDPIPSDYKINSGFEMFTYLNSEEASTFEPESEPLEAFSTINATMDKFFPRR